MYSFVIVYEYENTVSRLIFDIDEPNERDNRMQNKDFEYR